MIITIDGPAGSGKSTLAINIAKELGFFCLNSGYLYRGLAYVLKTYYGHTDEMLLSPSMPDVLACLHSDNLRYKYAYGVVHIFWGDIDISQFLQTLEMSKSAATIAQNDQVRAVIHDWERSLIAHKDSVIEGRAGGSTVFSYAEVKFFITATLEVRAQRMVQDQMKRGHSLSVEKALQAVLLRDQKDMSRKRDPLVVPEGAIILDTTYLSVEQVVKEAIEHVKKAMKRDLKMN
ncbi:(d)CMP kinase [Candidatus Dependentiae bacterium]|nr:(d)CMP kinase [Candidatus Dependentiae bacterium]